MQLQETRQRVVRSMATVLWTILIFASSVSCKREPRTTMESDLDLHIEEIGATPSSASGNEVKLRITLTNKSRADSIYVNSRVLLLVGRGCPDSIRDVWLDVRYEANRSPVEFLCAINGGSPTPDQYLALRPGGAISVERDLRCFPPKQPGPLLVTAHIDVAVPSSILPPGVKAPLLPVKSNQILVRTNR
jgi:hypothetical protein